MTTQLRKDYRILPNPNPYSVAVRYGSLAHNCIMPTHKATWTMQNYENAISNKITLREQQVSVLHTLSISAAGEDRDGLARIRVLGDGLAFLAGCCLNLFCHVHQTCFRQRSSRRRFPEDSTNVDPDQPAKLPRQPPRPTCFSGCCSALREAGKARVE